METKEQARLRKEILLRVTKLSPKEQVEFLAYLRDYVAERKRRAKLRMSDKER